MCHYSKRKRDGNKVILESPALFSEDALKEAKELIWRVRTLLQSALTVIFRDELELSVRRCMQNEDILSTNRTKQQLIDLANSV